MNTFKAKNNAVQRSLAAGVSGAEAKALDAKRAADRAAESAAFVNERLARKSAEAIELAGPPSEETLLNVLAMERSKHTFSCRLSFSREVRDLMVTINEERSAHNQLGITSEAAAGLHEAYDVAMLRVLAGHKIGN